MPVTLATGDEGVSRIDRVPESATTDRLRYLDLEQLARNSLIYSFLPGASLWQSPASLHPVPACAAEPAV